MAEEDRPGGNPNKLHFLAKDPRKVSSRSRDALQEVFARVEERTNEPGGEAAGRSQSVEGSFGRTLSENGAPIRSLSEEEQAPSDDASGELVNGGPTEDGRTLTREYLRLCLEGGVIMPQSQSLPPGEWDRVCFAFRLPLHDHESLSEDCQSSGDDGFLVVGLVLDPLKKDTVM